MPDPDIEKAAKLLEMGELNEAFPKLMRAIDANPNDSYALYLAGQCYRYMEDYDSAINMLNRSAEIDGSYPQIFLAYGIALQKSERYEDAINQFRKALEIDPRYVPACNSLALTQRIIGEYDKAEKNYKIAIENLLRGVADGLKNREDHPIWPPSNFKSEIGAEHVLFAALYLCAKDNIDVIATPNADMAISEHENRDHRGLFWVDNQQSDGKVVRLFLPNYFEDMYMNLVLEPTYSMLLGNRGRALDEGGNKDEGEKYYEAAHYFQEVRDYLTQSVQGKLKIAEMN